MKADSASRAHNVASRLTHSQRILWQDGLALAVALWARVSTCPDGEGRGHQQDLGAMRVHQLLVHGWEAQVVAHGHAQAAHRAVARHQLRAARGHIAIFGIIHEAKHQWKPKVPNATGCRPPPAALIACACIGND